MGLFKGLYAAHVHTLEVYQATHCLSTVSPLSRQSRVASDPPHPSHPSHLPPSSPILAIFPISPHLSGRCLQRRLPSPRHHPHSAVVQREDPHERSVREPPPHHPPTNRPIQRNENGRRVRLKKEGETRERRERRERDELWPGCWFSSSEKSTSTSNIIFSFFLPSLPSLPSRSSFSPSLPQVPAHQLFRGHRQHGAALPAHSLLRRTKARRSRRREC